MGCVWKPGRIYQFDIYTVYALVLLSDSPRPRQQLVQNRTWLFCCCCGPGFDLVFGRCLCVRLLLPVRSYSRYIRAGQQQKLEETRYVGKRREEKKKGDSR